MVTMYGRISLELLNAGSKSEKLGYVLLRDDGKLIELRWKNAPAFQSPDNSPFKVFNGLDVKIEGQVLSQNVVIVSKIMKRVP